MTVSSNSQWQSVYLFQAMEPEVYTATLGVTDKDGDASLPVTGTTTPEAFKVERRPKFPAPKPTGCASTSLRHRAERLKKYPRLEA